MSLPTVPLCDRRISRLIVGGNPFSGISHQTPERDCEMRDWYTVARIKQALAECEEGGVTAAVLRADAHIWRALREYWNEGGRIQWIAQTAPEFVSQERSIEAAAGNGAMACYLHGGVVDGLYDQGRLERIAELLDHIRAQGVPAGLAGHRPDVHLGIRQAGLAPDFHMVCFYDCGTVHAGEGERFDPTHPPRAAEAMRQIPVPCLAYKIFAAGRRDAREAFEFAYANIKPTDVVVMGVHTGDNPRMVAENVETARRLLGVQ